MGGFNLHRELTKLSPDERKAAIHRIDMVHAAQRRLGMEPRTDSLLTFNFATRRLGSDDAPSAIANELFIVDAIHQNTEYPQLIEEVLREIAEFVRAKYKLDWTTTWEIVRFYGPTMLKLYCIKTSQILPRLLSSASPEI